MWKSLGNGTSNPGGSTLWGMVVRAPHLSIVFLFFPWTFMMFSSVLCILWKGPQGVKDLTSRSDSYLSTCLHPPKNWDYRLKPPRPIWIAITACPGIMGSTKGPGIKLPFAIPVCSHFHPLRYLFSSKTYFSINAIVCFSWCSYVLFLSLAFSSWL